jgi:hypothetical protein
MKIPITWRYLLAFFCLGTLLGIGHEFAHHVAGFLICGDWGYKTFNSFELADGCSERHASSAWLATLAGPVLFNYIPIWFGVARLRRAEAGERLFGVSMIFAAVPLLRIVPNLWGANDESWITRELFGRSPIAFWSMNACIWIVTVPPLVFAWRAIENRRRLLVFALFLVIVPGFVALFFGGVLEPLIVQRRLLPGALLGIPFLVWLAELLATVGYWQLKPQLRAPAL